MKFDNDMTSAVENKMKQVGVRLEGQEATDGLRQAFFAFNSDGTLVDPNQRRDYFQKVCIEVIQDKIDNGVINNPGV